MDITADINIEELIEEHPQAAGFLADRGLVCIRCGEPYWGTMRELAATKGLADQIDQMARDLAGFLAVSPKNR
jgi:hypothetical protein